jgi:purine-nucleoside phosphorylase
MVVSGSGLTTDLLPPIGATSPWSEIIPFPIHGIVGHPLEIQLLDAGDDKVVLHSRGRLHAYQGFTPAQTCFTVRLAALLGARVLVLTNSAGGLHEHHRPGDLLVLQDQLNLSGLNPLYGEPPEAWGPRFPDMSAAFDPALRQQLLGYGEELEIPLKEGVYAGLLGPSYETPAEVRMLRQLGGDAVGMSTVLEVIAARHMGLRCAGISLITNPGAGVTDEILDHVDVLTKGREAASHLRQLLGRLLSDPKTYSA